LSIYWTVVKVCHNCAAISVLDGLRAYIL